MKKLLCAMLAALLCLMCACTPVGNGSVSDPSAGSQEQDTPDAPDTPPQDTPGTTDTPDTPDTSDTPDAPDTPEDPGTPDEPEPVSAAVLLLQENLSSLSSADDVTLTLEQYGESISFTGTTESISSALLSKNLLWKEVPAENYVEFPPGGWGRYGMTVSCGEGSGAWSLSMRTDSPFFIFVCGGETYYFSQQSSSADLCVRLRGVFDAWELAAIRGGKEGDLIFVSDSGQDYLAAAAEGLSAWEEACLYTTSLSLARYTFVKTIVEADEVETAMQRADGSIGENTWAFYLETVFVPENTRADYAGRAGSTTAYTGDDPDVPGGALHSVACCLITKEADGWYIKICGTSW